MSKAVKGEIYRVSGAELEVTGVGERHAFVKDGSSDVEFSLPLRRLTDRVWPERLPDGVTREPALADITKYAYERAGTGANGLTVWAVHGKVGIRVGNVDAYTAFVPVETLRWLLDRVAPARTAADA